MYSKPWIIDHNYIAEEGLKAITDALISNCPLTHLNLGISVADL
jgi:hypothetical protein